MRQPFRITIEQYETKTMVEYMHSDISIDQMINAIESVLLGAGWCQEQVDQILGCPNNELQEWQRDILRKENERSQT